MFQYGQKYSEACWDSYISYEIFRFLISRHFITPLILLFVYSRHNMYLKHFTKICSTKWHSVYIITTYRLLIVWTTEQLSKEVALIILIEATWDNITIYLIYNFYWYNLFILILQYTWWIRVPAIYKIWPSR